MSNAATSTQQAVRVGIALRTDQSRPTTGRRLPVQPVDTNACLTTFNTGPARLSYVQDPVFTTVIPHKVNAKGKASRSSQRFSPQLIATDSTRPIRRQKMSASVVRPIRRFTPQLIETDKRFSFSNDSKSPFFEPTYHHGSVNNATSGTTRSYPYPEESRFSFQSLKKRQEERLMHKEEFHPTLSAIDSDSSEEEREEEEEDDRKSRHTQLFSSSFSRRRSDRPSESHRRESCDDSVSKYLLSLVQDAVKKQISDVTLATFPTEQVHHSVSHFAASDERSDSSMSGDHVRDTRNIIDNLNVGIHSDPKEVAAHFRRNSLVDIGYEIAQLRKSKEECERRAKEKRLAGEDIQDPTDQLEKKGSDKKKQDEEEEQKIVNNAVRKKQEATDLERLRLLEPPMMGDDIVFPQCLSPQTTACTPDQLPQPGFFRLDENQRRNEPPDSAPLWQRAAPTTPPKPSKPAGGLWNGLCKKSSDHSSGAARSKFGWMTPALVTPATEPVDPFQSQTFQNTQMPCFSSMSHLPSTPPASNPTTPPPEGSDIMDIDTDDLRRQIGCSRFKCRRQSLLSVEDREARIVSEFPDSFVSQIYDYLSLGYPSLAHPFDEELSKISKFPVVDLREDDRHTNSQGYVLPPIPSPKPEDCFSLRRFPNRGAGSKKVNFDDLVKNKKCMRWCALRLYIREWARQQSSWLDDDRDRTELMKMRAIPAPPRKGSWAI